MLFKKAIKLLWSAQVFVSLMSACAPVLTSPDPPPTVPAVEPTAASTVTLAPTATEIFIVRATPEPLSSEIVLPPFLCSPLAVQPLESIAEIITQPFIAPRQLDDGTYKDDAHHGVDLGYYTRNGENFTGTPVLSATNGRIAAVIHDRPPYGDAILVETPYEQIPAHVIESQSILPGHSLYVLYAHLQNLPAFSLQQKVACGDPLAETGLTGFTGGPHLHFETRWGPAGQGFESLAYYHVNTSEEERANYVTWRMSGTFRLFDPMILLSPPIEN
jgi:murein DD-endopeptidase MepM/ murein hydrolase activator NlpD